MESTNCFVANIASIYQPDVLPIPYFIQHPPMMQATPITANIVGSTMSTLNTHKSPGPDGLQSHLLRLLTLVISQPLVKLV